MKLPLRVRISAKLASLSIKATIFARIAGELLFSPLAVYAFWFCAVTFLIGSRCAIVGVLDTSPVSLYKDAAHLLFGGAFVYACFLTKDARRQSMGPWGYPEGDPAKEFGAAVLWLLIACSVVVETALALRDNF